MRIQESNKNKTEKKKYKFLPLSLRIETLGGIATPLILRGTPLPALRTQQFSTAVDNQEKVEIKMLMGESSVKQNNIELKKLSMKGIPKAPRGKPKIIVTFEVDTSCNVKITAIEKDSGLKINVDYDEIQSSLTDDEIKRLLHQAEENKEDDNKLLRIIEAKNKAEALIDKAEKVMRERQEKGYNTQIDKNIEKSLASLGLALDEKNEAKIHYEVANLEKMISSIIPKDFSDLFGPFQFDDVFSAFNYPKTTKKKSSNERPKSTGPQVPRTLRRKSNDELATESRTSKGFGRIFGGGDFTLDPNLCFVLMPFESKMESIYKDCIRYIVESEGLSCLRADEIVSTNQITRDIWEKINRARFIIADLTGKNPNVFYEVGIAHSIGKEVLLLTQSMDDVPFDLSAIRCIVYNETKEEINRLKSKLRQTIKRIMQSS